MRGLKRLFQSGIGVDIIVASFTDAWIETKRGTTTREIGNVASFTDAWIETLNNSRVFIQLPVASFTDAWIETFVPRKLPYMTASRIFYRCVD